MTGRSVPLAVGGLAVLVVVVLLAFNAPALLSTATTYRADFTEAAGLQSGDLVTWEGDYFRVDSARVWDAPEGGVPIAIAVSGEKSVAQFAPLAPAIAPQMQRLAEPCQEG